MPTKQAFFILIVLFMLSCTEGNSTVGIESKLTQGKKGDALPMDAVNKLKKFDSMLNKSGSDLHHSSYGALSSGYREAAELAIKQISAMREEYMARLALEYGHYPKLDEQKNYVWGEPMSEVQASLARALALKNEITAKSSYATAKQAVEKAVSLQQQEANAVHKRWATAEGAGSNGRRKVDPLPRRPELVFLGVGAAPSKSSSRGTATGSRPRSSNKKNPR